MTRGPLYLLLCRTKAGTPFWTFCLQPSLLGRAPWIMLGPVTPGRYGIDAIAEAMRALATREGFDLDDPATWPKLQKGVTA